MTVSDSRKYHRAKYLVRAYPGTTEGMQAARWLADRHAKFLAQRGPIQTPADRLRLARERYHRNPKPTNDRNNRRYHALTPDQRQVRRKRANARLRERFDADPDFHKRRYAAKARAKKV